MSFRPALYCTMSLMLASCSTTNPPTKQTQFSTSNCEVGVFGQSQEFLVITRSGKDFRYNFSDGRIGNIEEQGPVSCAGNAVAVNASSIWEKQNTPVHDTRFSVENAVLAGQLIEPENTNQDTPLIVFAHGSEEHGWIESMPDPYQFVGRGISVFVYDKRGTGLSSGAYNQNFPQLADDLVAASAEAKRIAEGRFGRFGLVGLSQGGWIVPLAAERTDAQFIGIGYGLVIDILEEDAAQVELELRGAGYDEDIIEKAREVTDTTALIATSSYKKGVDELDALKSRYGNEAWFSNIKGGFSGVILSMSTDELRTKGIPMFDRLNIDWSLAPLDVLRLVNVPQFWVLAEEDREAPIEKTLERLQILRSDGKDISIHTFPNTDHGMWEFEQTAEGKRNVTRITDGYFSLMADSVKGKLQAEYGKAVEK